MLNRYVFISVALFLWSAGILAQPNVLGADTLLFQNFESSEDPGLTMLPSPTGEDDLWVNYDADMAPSICIDSLDKTPGGWYWEGDLSDKTPNDNYAFTSCSWLADENVRSQNWLITPQIFVPDENQSLFWRSLSLTGPSYHDGYKVLLSTTSNNPEDSAFVDTLFVQGEMRYFKVTETSLNVDDFVYSPGYIQADRYTDTNYFFLDTVVGNFGTNIPFLHGKMTPHSVSLSKYSNKWVYIAFLHDSDNDFILQVDDIVVSKATSSSTHPEFVRQFEVFPNPAQSPAWVYWSLESPKPLRFFVVGVHGQLFWERVWNDQAPLYHQFQLPELPAGMYHCVLEGESGAAHRTLLVQGP